MGLINRLYTFATTPGVDPAIGAQIDAEINQILNLVNGALDNTNVGGNPDIASDKLSLGGAGFLPLGGGSLTAVLNHLFSGIWRTMGASGGVLTREYRDTGVGVAWGLAYNTYYTGSGWAGRDVSDICMRMELTTTGMFRLCWAVSAGSGVAPTWYPAQYVMPSGYSRYHNGTVWSSEFTDASVTTITSDPAVSGIFNYNKLTINAGVTWTLEQGKPLIIIARDTVTINGTIDGNGKGALGGSSGVGDNALIGGTGGGGGGGAAGGYTGYKGGDSYHLGYLAIGGNGNVGVGSNGPDAPIARLISIPHEVSYNHGGAGGGHGGLSSTNSGGNGGGFVYILAPQITLGSTGIVRCDGLIGGAGAPNSGGGGGGGGGVVWMQTKSCVLSGTVTVNKGNGGAGGGTGSAGGNGGAGVIFIEELR